MIKVSVLYPGGEGNTFDMSYYSEKHILLVKNLLGAACKKITVEKGLAGMEPGSNPVYATMGHLYFESVEDFQNAFAPHANAIMGDISNYTNATPLIQISEVIL